MLSVAHAMMRRHSIRHLPVLKGGKLVGLVSDRDLRFIETLKDVDPEKVSVEEAMATDIYAIDPSDPLAKAASEMAERKLGSAVVMQQGKIVGILTTTDICRALADLLRR
jgi:acetoin utilization protein AcuB